MQSMTPLKCTIFPLVDGDLDWKGSSPLISVGFQYNMSSKWDLVIVNSFLNKRASIKSIYKWPTATNDVIHFPIEEILDHCKSVRPILHRDTLCIIEKYLQFKKFHGASVGSLQS